jgi:hypothetical protein
MKLVAEECFQASRTQLLKTLDSCTRRNQMLFALGLVASACAIFATIACIIATRQFGGSATSWLDSLAMPALLTLTLIESSRRLMRMYERGTRDCMLYQQELQQVELMKLATMVAMSTGNHEVVMECVANAADVKRSQRVLPAAQTSSDRSTSSESIVSLQDYMLRHARSSNDLTRGAAVSQSLKRWRSRVIGHPSSWARRQSALSDNLDAPAF